MTVTPQVLKSTDDVRYLKVEERGCKFMDEADESSLFSSYSHKGCLFECAFQRAMVKF